MSFGLAEETLEGDQICSIAKRVFSGPEQCAAQGRDQRRCVRGVDADSGEGAGVAFPGTYRVRNSRVAACAAGGLTERTRGQYRAPQNLKFSGASNSPSFAKFRRDWSTGGGATSFTVRSRRCATHGAVQIVVPKSPLKPPKNQNCGNFCFWGFKGLFGTQLVRCF